MGKMGNVYRKGNKMVKMEIVNKIAAGIGVLIVIALLISLPTMLLWNWLMPKIFGLTQIGFSEALGLCFLGGFLFGGVSKK